MFIFTYNLCCCLTKMQHLKFGCTGLAGGRGVANLTYSRIPSAMMTNDNGTMTQISCFGAFSCTRGNNKWKQRLVTPPVHGYNGGSPANNKMSVVKKRKLTPVSPSSLWSSEGCTPYQLVQYQRQQGTQRPAPQTGPGTRKTYRN